MKCNLFWLLIGAMAALPSFAADSVAARPNIIVLLADDFGWGDAGCFGGRVATPAIDRLAAEGTRFTQFYVASPICSASRCGIITGQYPARWNITSYLQTRAGNRSCEQADFLDPRAPSLPRTLKEAGYATAHIGKWHLGGGRDVTDAPVFAKYGYDVGLGTYESPEPAAALGLHTTPWELNREPQQVERHDRTRWMVDQTLNFLKAHRGQPCMVNLWPDDVHTPHRPSQEQATAVKEAELPEAQKRFRAVVSELDHQVGRLMEGLRALGIETNTLIIFAGDNGPEPTFNHARTGGLRGMKWSLYEGGIRTPLIVRWPGVVPEGRVDRESVVSSVDLFPTVCSLAGLAVASGTTFDGEDVANAFRGNPHTRSKPLFWEYGRTAGTTTKESFRYPTEPGAKSPNVAVRDGKWKLLINADGNGSQLYDLQADANEATDLAAKEPEITARLTRAALAWRSALPKLETKP